MCIDDFLSAKSLAQMIISSFLLLMFWLNKFIAHCCWFQMIFWNVSELTRLPFLLYWSTDTSRHSLVAVSCLHQRIHVISAIIWFGVCSFCNLESTWASSALFAVAVQTTKVTLQRGYCSSNCMQQAITKLKTSVTTFANACFNKDSFQLRLPEQYNLQYMLKAAWAIFNKGID